METVVYLKKFPRYYLALGVLLVLGLDTFVLRWLFSSRQEAPQSVAVITGSIEETVTAQGQLEPKEYVNIGAQVSGQLLKLHVNLGDSVQQGQLMAEINPEIYQARVAADQAKLNTLQAQYNEQQALVEQAGWIDRRNTRLLSTKAVSQEAYEQSLTSLKVAKAKLLALDAQIQEAKSALEGDTANLNFTRIYASMTGTVVEQIAREGETLNANQSTPTIVKVANLDLMTARAQVAEADISRLREGMPVYFTTLGGQGRKWHGKVRQILPTPETINDVILYNVLMDIDNKDRALMTDMSAQMFFVLGSAENVPLIPVSSLGKRAAGTAGANSYEVQVLRAGREQTVTVRIGMMTRSLAQVLEGLQPEDRIITGLPSDSRKTQSGRPRMPVL